MIDPEAFHRLGIALALGLALGIERGWQQREVEEGARVAGVRTFSLAALLGGLAQVLAQEWGGPAALGVVFAAYAALITVAYAMTARAHKAYGVTTEVAALLTFSVGALAVAGRPLVAAAVTVAALVILRSKAAIHGWVARLESKEIRAAITLGLISVVVLPLLPREPVDHWGVLDLYEIWWMVVLVAGLSFAGYAAVRIVGSGRGLLLTALLGALVSSTAVTLTFSRLARTAPALSRLLAAGVVGACSIMPLRVLLVAGAVNGKMVAPLAPAMIAMSLAGFVTVLVLWRRPEAAAPEQEVPLKNPLELGMALKLALMLVVVLLLAEGLRSWMGESGIYLLALVSGLTDVDAINLSLSRLARDSLEPAVAARGILLAAASNTALKGALALAVGGGAMGRRAALGLGIMLAAGFAGLLLGPLLLP